MKLFADDLSIYDWVVYDGDVDLDCPVQVDGLTTDDLSVENGFLGGDEDMVAPIPITRWNLAKNGWEPKNGVMVFKNDVIRLGWKEDCTLIFGYYEWPIKVTAVHQLQHILRDVGLVEYANSMRV